MADTKLNIKQLSKLPKELKKELLAQVKKAKKRWEKPGIKQATKIIDDTIAKGISPVKSGGAQTGRKPRFVKYSELYRKQIRRKVFPGKKLRPVNLELSGKMRKSIGGRATKDGILIFYRDPKADYHTNQGVGKSRVIRRMLPGEGTNEVLSRTVTKPLVELFVKILKQV